MGQDTEIHEPKLPPAHGPGAAHFDLLKWMSVLMQIGQMVAVGNGSFVTWTPLGRKRITVADP